MTTETVQIALLGALVLLLVTAMVTDWRRRDIPNWLTATAALIAPLWWWANGFPFWPDIGMHLIVFAIVLAIGIALFAVGGMGGGDVKLLAALALWLTGLDFMRMAIVMSLIGGVLTTAMIAWHFMKRENGGPRVPSGLVLSFAFWVLAAAALWAPVEWRLTALLACVAGALLFAMRVGRGIPREQRPETPYGLAISAAALLIIAERNLNQFV